MVGVCMQTAVITPTNVRLRSGWMIRLALKVAPFLAELAAAPSPHHPAPTPTPSCR